MENIFIGCNMNCNCLIKIWDFVCGENGLSYMSVCFVGCEIFVGIGIDMVIYFFFFYGNYVLCILLVFFNYELGLYLIKVKLKIFFKIKLFFLWKK